MIEQAREFLVTNSFELKSTQEELSSLRENMTKISDIVIPQVIIYFPFVPVYNDDCLTGIIGSKYCFCQLQLEQRASESLVELLANEETIRFLDTCLVSTQQDGDRLKQTCTQMEQDFRGISPVCFIYN